MHNSTTRFSTRVANYVKYRPGYPDAAIDLLVERCGLSAKSSVADIGSGTGISAEPLLKRGVRVIGVEPNQAMREAGDALLAHHPGFTSVNGTAEATGLPDSSIDLVLAGQAYHWFDPPAAALEFKRILRAPGWVALIWNDRQTDSTPFLRDYEALLQTFSTDYAAIDHKNAKPDRLGIAFERAQFANSQRFDFDGVAGRLLSSSYAPEADDPRYMPMMAELRRIVDAHQVDGAVDVLYTTDVFIGRFG
jgi:SAM-dependent methyltransferase